MSAGGEVLVTREGWRRFHAELRSLEERRSFRLSERLPDRSAVELAEAAWAASNSDVAPLDRRIAELRAVLARAAPVSHGGEPGTIGIGSCVTVRWEDGAEETYTIVGPPEVNSRLGHISYECPVGRALVGSRAGMEVDVSTERGPVRLKVLAVE